MSWVGFEPTIPDFERAKTFYALDRAVTNRPSSDIASLNNRKSTKKLSVYFLNIGFISLLAICQKARHDWCSTCCYFSVLKRH
jgi:hypothetical protein